MYTANPTCHPAPGNNVSTDQAFESLSPDTVIDAIESTGRLSDLRIFALNSYENRVYQVGIEDEKPVIVKFYRPGRWSDESILEEHRFSVELADAELPVVAPIRDSEGKTLLRFGDFRFSLYTRVGGYTPELEDPDQLLSLGRILGRMHAIGAISDFRNRPTVDIASYAIESMEFIARGFIPDGLRTPYTTLCESLIKQLEADYQPGNDALIRTHGDLHKGNILWRDDDLCLVDLDDCRMAPAIQDIWMLLAGEAHEKRVQLSEIVDGYEEFNDFPVNQLRWIEPLRTLRIMHYAAW